MKCSLKQRQILSILFLMGYIFVAFFAHQFHNHEHHSDSNSVEKSFIEGTHDDVSDCLACHIVHQGKHLSTQDFSLNFIVNIEYSKIQIENIFSKYIRPIDSGCLRGPPVLV